MSPANVSPQFIFPSRRPFHQTFLIHCQVRIVVTFSSQRESMRRLVFLYSPHSPLVLIVVLRQLPSLFGHGLPPGLARDLTFKIRLMPPCSVYLIAFFQCPFFTRLCSTPLLNQLKSSSHGLYYLLAEAAFALLLDLGPFPAGSPNPSGNQVCSSTTFFSVPRNSFVTSEFIYAKFAASNLAISCLF